MCVTNPLLTISIFLALYFVLALTCHPFIAYASEPEILQEKPFSDKEHIWFYKNFMGSQELIVSSNSANSQIARYDISDCMLCSGAEDNCNVDGIRSFTLSQTNNEPLLIAACHMGALIARNYLFLPHYLFI